MDPYGAAAKLVEFGRLSLLQFAVMAALSLLLFEVTPIAAFIYGMLQGLVSYLPILWRYRDLFEMSGHGSGFPIMFSISVVNIGIQLVFLTLICSRLYGKISLRSPARVAAKNNVLFAILLIVSLDPSLELLTGPVDLGSVSPSTGGSLLSAASLYFRNCLIVPCANILFSFLILAEFAPSSASPHQN